MTRAEIDATYLSTFDLVVYGILFGAALFGFSIFALTGIVGYVGVNTILFLNNRKRETQATPTCQCHMNVPQQRERNDE